MSEGNGKRSGAPPEGQHSCVEQEFALYVHYPLCRERCGYCDFPVVTARDFPNRRYTDAVLQELDAREAGYRGRRLASVFFGGGTPSLWPPDMVAEVIAAARRTFRCSAALEVTLEANPANLGASLLEALLQAGVNRLSLGVQSFDDATLRRLTRDHTALEARQAVARAREVGFESVSCDLIIGLAGQTSEMISAELGELARVAPDHVSLYSLTLASGSRLYRAGARQVSDDLAAEMLELGRERLEREGWPQYEVSNYASEAHRSIHNLRVWQGCPYLGLGAAAHSLWIDGAAHVRIINPPFSRYLQARPVPGHPAQLSGARRRALAPETARFEFMMLGLRTSDGVSRVAYARRFGCDPLVDHGPSFERLRAWGLVSIDQTRIRPTRRGIWFADELACRI